MMLMSQPQADCASLHPERPRSSETLILSQIRALSENR